MKSITNITEIAQIEKLETEHDLQKASQLERKLRLMIAENPELRPIRKKLRDLIWEYEDRKWANFEQITDSQVTEAEDAERTMSDERRFVKKRKEVIRKKLQEYHMTQQDLGVLLGHPKSYISELINGVSRFTMKDLVIIHRVFGIQLDALIPTHLQSETQDQIRNSIEKLNNPKLKFGTAKSI